MENEDLARMMFKIAHLTQVHTAVLTISVALASPGLSITDSIGLRRKLTEMREEMDKTTKSIEQFAQKWELV